LSVALKLEKKKKKARVPRLGKEFPLHNLLDTTFYRENNFKEIKMYHKVTKEKLKEENWKKQLVP
jgi:hypothetical protein